jgi:signal transduction histidine kinase
VFADEARKLVEAERNRTFRMSAMIDELLSATISIHSDKEGQEASSEQAIGEAIDRVRPLLEKKQIEIELPDQFPWVAGDRVRLREAFYNLLSNAAKFIDKRPGRIAIEVETHGAECVFAIADNGPGIPPDELDRIFVPFRRLPIHRDHPGSGLGLYFTKNLVEQQGGRVWAESELGKGSRFVVVLKRVGA